jgi:hypothetical protein
MTGVSFTNAGILGMTTLLLSAAPLSSIGLVPNGASIMAIVLTCDPDSPPISAKVIRIAVLRRGGPLLRRHRQWLVLPVHSRRRPDRLAALRDDEPGAGHGARAGRHGAARHRAARPRGLRRRA